MQKSLSDSPKSDSTFQSERISHLFGVVVVMRVAIRTFVRETVCACAGRSFFIELNKWHLIPHSS